MSDSDDPLIPVGDPVAHARIDALQREVAYQLNQLWTAVRGDHGHVSTAEEAQERFGAILATFREADKLADRGMQHAYSKDTNSGPLSITKRTDR